MLVEGLTAEDRVGVARLVCVEEGPRESDGLVETLADADAASLLLAVIVAALETVEDGLVEGCEENVGATEPLVVTLAADEDEPEGLTEGCEEKVRATDPLVVMLAAGEGVWEELLARLVDAEAVTLLLVDVLAEDVRVCVATVLALRDAPADGVRPRDEDALDTEVNDDEAVGLLLFVRVREVEIVDDRLVEVVFVAVCATLPLAVELATVETDADADGARVEVVDKLMLAVFETVGDEVGALVPDTLSL